MATKGKVLFIIGALFFFLSAISHASDRPKAKKLPNILWISCEDLSPHFSFYGDSTLSTPNLSRLASEGVVYDNVFTTAGVCAPSRCAIITGVNQVTAGGHNMRTLYSTFPEKTGLPKSYSIVTRPGIKAFPEYLRAKGYYCTNNSKTDYQFEAPPTVWDENSVTASWRNRKPGQPFFAVVNYTITHESQVWQRKGHPLHVDPSKVKVPPIYPDTRTVRKDIARFLSNVIDMDSLIGGLLLQLEEDGLMDSTIIFFWSDHGDGLPFMKRELYDRGLHVPLVIRFPEKQNAGKRNDLLISAIDFAPTVLSIANVEPPAHMQGKAFLGEYKTKASNQYVYAARDRMDSEYDRVRAVRDKRYKYIRNFHPELPLYQNIEFRLQQDMMKEILELKEKGELDSIQMKWFVPRKPAEELYDLQNDPYEIRNLVSDPSYQGHLVRLRKEMDRWLKEVNDLGAIPEKELVSKMWKGKDGPPVTQDVVIEFHKDKISLSCKTEGASIGYKIVREGQDAWMVYTKPFKIAKGQSIKVVAQRIGYEISKETVKKF
jgi:N-sulfoglucosamine sulfohydrolase